MPATSTEVVVSFFFFFQKKKKSPPKILDTLTNVKNTLEIVGHVRMWRVSHGVHILVVVA